MSNSLETKSYTLYLSSSDKISGTNNNATFNINFDDFLPREYDTYKLVYNFQSGGGLYQDSIFTTDKNVTIVNGIMTVAESTAIIGDGIRVGQLLTDDNITFPTYILSYGSGTGQSTGVGVTGTYNITNNNQNILSIPIGSQYFSGCKIQMNLGGRSYSFESSQTLGYTKKENNIFSSFYLENVPKTISRPTQNQITISLYNLNYSNILLYDTDLSGNILTDCTPWNIIIEFIPILNAINSYNKNIN